MMKRENEIFERSCEEAKFYKYIQKIQKKLNYNNFPNFFYTPKKLFHPSEFLEYERYVFTLLKIWAMENEEYSFKYLEKLKFLIKKYSLSNRLSVAEQSYLQVVEEVVFNSKRNLKNIVVDFSTISNESANEEIFYHFINVNLVSVRNSSHGEVFITNSRIVISDETLILSIPFSDMDSYKLTQSGIKIFAYNQEFNFLPGNDDPRVFYVAFERVYYGNTKRKNN